MSIYKHWLVLLFVISLLSGCGRPYIAKIQFESPVSDFSTLESDFNHICSKIYPKAKTFEVDNENHKKVIFCGEKNKYPMTIFALTKSEEAQSFPIIEWGVMGSHFGTSIGNTSFPKWYCEKYNSIRKEWGIKHKVAHDKRLFKNCSYKTKNVTPSNIKVLNEH